MSCIAAYDFGTSGVKAALIGRDGSILAVREKGYPLLKPAPLYVEQKPDDFWNAVCDVTRGVLEDSGVAPSDVSGLSFGVQAVTLIPVDREGNVLRNAISWLDGRAIEQADEINKACGMDLVRSQDYQPRILWIKKNEPEIYEETAYFLECDGYLQYRATGIMAVPGDYDGILKYHPAIEEYFDATLASVDRSKLPPVVEACREYGKLDEKGAAELGLCPGTPVFGGMIDVSAAAAGCGCVQPGDAHLYLGSSGWLSAIIDRPYETAEGAYQINSIIPGLMIYGGCTNCCCLMQNWAIDRFYQTEHKELGDGIFDFINREMENVPAGCDGLFSTPWLFGEQFPIADPYVRANFFNISEGHTRAHFMKAVLEGVCFSMKGQIDAYKKDTGCDIKEIGVNGGGSLSSQWMQMMADILGIPVYVPENTRHSGAIGAAAAAAIGLGWFTIENVKEFVKKEKVFYPDTRLSEMYGKKYRAWFKLYDSIKDLSRELNQE